MPDVNQPRTPLEPETQATPSKSTSMECVEPELVPVRMVSAPMIPNTLYWLVMGMAITVSGSGGAVGAVLGTNGHTLSLSKRAVNCMPLPTVITFDTVAPNAAPALAAFP